MAEGKEVELFSNLDMTPIIMLMGIMIMLAVLPAMVTPVAQTLQAQAQAQAYHGTADPRTVKVVNRLSWINLVHEYPFTPWVSVYFINDGPSAVEIGINYPDNRFVMEKDETITITRTGAQERISIIFFIAHPGLNASVRVSGEY